ncbi:hypothetical protein NL529_32910, partial [Klebsiella pneumoniae]|nr:hypothetical protein [Klebsiella pneumoniae]
KGLISAVGPGTIISTPGELSNASYNAQVSNFAQGLTEFTHPDQPLSGEDVTIWMMSHDNSGNLTCNGASLPCFTGDKIRVC